MAALSCVPVLLALATLANAQGQVTLEWARNPEADVAGYVLYLGTVSGEPAMLVDAGDNATHTFSGLDAGTVYFCRLQAYNTDGLVSEPTPELMFTLESGALDFGGWAAAGGLNGAAALPDAMPHHDGVPNLLKFAFNLNPAQADVRRLAKGTGTAGLPVFALEQNAGQPAFTVEFLRRRASGLVYTPETGTALAGFMPMAGNTTVTAVNTEWDRVVVKMPLEGSPPPRMFGRVAVKMP